MNHGLFVEAFQYMAVYIRQHNLNVTIYLAEGAVNTNYFRYR